MKYRFWLAAMALFTLASLMTGKPAMANEEPQHAAVFGGTSITEHETAPAVGVEYEYRLPYAGRRFGIGPLVEATFGAHATPLLAAAGVTVHPLLGFKAFALGGSETAEGHTVFAARTGLGYDFHMGSVSISPLANFDYADGHLIQVYGLTVGMGFGAPTGGHHEQAGVGPVTH